MFRKLRGNAHKRGIPVDLDFAGFVKEIGGTFPTVCPILGIPIFIGGDRMNAPSVDRIDSARGYESGNIAIISYRANVIKSFGTIKEHLAVANWMKSRQHGDSVRPEPVKTGKGGRPRSRNRSVRCA